MLWDNQLVNTVNEWILENKDSDFSQNLGQSRFIPNNRCINANVCGADTEGIIGGVLPLRVGVARTAGVVLIHSNWRQHQVSIYIMSFLNVWRVKRWSHNVLFLFGVSIGIKSRTLTLIRLMNRYTGRPTHSSTLAAILASRDHAVGTRHSTSRYRDQPWSAAHPLLRVVSRDVSPGRRS